MVKNGLLAVAVLAGLLLTATLAPATRPATRRLEPMLDDALPVVGVAALQQDREHALDGSGVIVGIVDTGIDWRSDVFADEEGRTRILYLLDLAREGEAQEIETYGGALWTGEQIEAARNGAANTLSLDTIGHGTFVSSIAAGRGVGEASDGVAPAADLIVVNASRNNEFAFDETDVINAVDFILERAEALSRPVVINLSAGSHFGPHDGSSALAQALDARVGDAPGRAIVVSSGNMADKARQASLEATPGQAQRLEFRIPVYERVWERPSVAQIELWYPKAEACTVRLLDGDGATVLEVGSGEEARDLSPTRGSMTLTHQVPSSERPSMVSAELLVQEPETETLQPGTYFLEVEGASGHLNAWVTLAGRFGLRFAGDTVSSQASVTVPGTARNVITVGAWSSKTSWTAGGAEYAFPPSDGVSPFSGRGPTRDGRLKPDLLAPGDVVAATLAQGVVVEDSIYASLSKQGFDPVLDDARAVLRGTSVATPFVTGAAALWFERHPDASANDVKAVLQNTAGEGHGPAGGFGLLSVAQLLQQGPSGAADPERSRVVPSGYELGGIGSRRVEVWGLFIDKDGNPTAPLPGAELRVVSGQPLQISDAEALAHRVRFEVSASEVGGTSTVALFVGEERYGEPFLLTTTDPEGAACLPVGCSQRAPGCRTDHIVFPKWLTLCAILFLWLLGAKQRPS